MDSDLRWLWVAYKEGMWRDTLPDEMSVHAFNERALEVIAEAPFDWILEARVGNGTQPVGIVLGRTTGSGVEPFVQWFPWASVRNKVEATAAFLKEVPSQFKVFIFAREGEIDCWSKFVHYGMIRRGCKVIDYFARGDHAMMYYTAGP